MPETSLPFAPTTPLPARDLAPGSGGARAAGANALRAGTCLGEFEIVRLLGSGGFGMVYLANDRLLLRQVAIKEYMPVALAGRRLGETMLAPHESAAGDFSVGLASFLNEAQLLARFDHPALVKVYRFWQANNTAYMAMPYYIGRTLKDTRLTMRDAPDETWLRTLVDPLLSALELLHRQGVFHRDISPDNIMILPDGRPVLLDFGSARRAFVHRTQAMTVLLKPHFAPVEQYGDDTHQRQGPWTDLYALGATLHFALTGRLPVPSVLRAVRDDQPPLAGPSIPALAHVSQRLRATIDWAMTLSPNGRPQDISAFRLGLDGQVSQRPDFASLDSQAKARPASAGSAIAEERSIPPRTWLRPLVVVGIVVTIVALAATTAVGLGRWRGHAVASEGATLPSLAHPVDPLTETTPASARPVPTTAASQATPPAPAASSPNPPQAFASAASPLVAPLSSTRKVRAVTAPLSRAVNPPERATTPTKSPIDACAELSFFGRQMCVLRQCRRAEMQKQSQCVEPRRTEEERQRRMQQ